MLVERLKDTYEILVRSKAYGIVSDLNEMKNRIHETFRGLQTFCKEETGPLVSIVIPTLNEALRIKSLLRSLENSCYENIEIIVADYKSKDGTPDIAKRMGAKVLECDKQGVGYQTFIAVKKSRGEIIIRTDADTIFPRHIIKTVVDMLNKNKLIAHIGHVYYDGGFIENLFAFLYDKYLRKPWNTTGHFIAFKREIVEKGLNFNPQLMYHEDWEFGRRAFEKLGKDAFIYDYKHAILVSARRIHRTGLLNYLLGR